MEHLENQAKLLLHGQILLFIVFMGLAWVVNRILKHKRVNGALFFVICSVLLFTLPTLNLFRANLPGEAGQRASFYTYLSLAYFLPIVVGIVLAASFRRERRIDERQRQKPDS